MTIRSRADLIVENAMLRQQLVALNHQVKRPQLTNGGRIQLVLLARCTQFWQQALHIIQPDTLLRWHRDLFRRHWRRKSKNKKRKPRIAQETIELIRQMAKENRLWGAVTGIPLSPFDRRSRGERSSLAGNTVWLLLVCFTSF